MPNARRSLAAFTRKNETILAKLRFLQMSLVLAQTSGDEKTWRKLLSINTSVLESQLKLVTRYVKLARKGSFRG